MTAQSYLEGIERLCNTERAAGLLVLDMVRLTRERCLKAHRTVVHPDLSDFLAGTDHRVFSVDELAAPCGRAVGDVVTLLVYLHLAGWIELAVLADYRAARVQLTFRPAADYGAALARRHG